MANNISTGFSRRGSNPLADDFFYFFFRFFSQGLSLVRSSNQPTKSRADENDKRLLLQIILLRRIFTAYRYDRLLILTT